MRILNLIQGSAQWHEHRSNAWNASDAPAMLGESPHCSRSELLHRMATGITPEVDANTQRRFDAGHTVEALLRQHAESIVGEPLHPFVGVADFNDRLSASFDGCTFVGDEVSECKLLNARLRAAFGDMETIAPEHRDRGAGKCLPIDYRIQMEQQARIAGAVRVLFLAGELRDDGTLGDVLSCWYYPDDALWSRILAGWPQFEADRAAYKPAAITEMPKAEVSLALPALFIHAKGEITTSNMKEYGVALAERLASVRAIQLITDQDFSNAKESAKLLRENIQQAKLAKDAMLAQTVTVGEAARMIDTWCEDMRLTALKLEQDVEREDKAKKAAMIAKAKGDYEKHIQALIAETGGPWIVLPAPNFAEAIKNKRSFTSMQDALDTMLANGKIAADDSARKIRANLACIKDDGAGFEFLFADRLALIGKPIDDLRTLIRARITEHKAAEQKKADDLREKIRAEERATAEKEAREKFEREQNEQIARDREAARQAAEAAKPAPTPASAPIAAPELFSPAANVVPLGTRAPAADSTATIRLGQINDRLQLLAVTAQDLADLGFQPVATQQASKLYRAADFERICAALIKHLMRVAVEQPVAA